MGNIDVVVIGDRKIVAHVQTVTAEIDHIIGDIGQGYLIVLTAILLIGVI